MITRLASFNPRSYVRSDTATGSLISPSMRFQSTLLREERPCVAASLDSCAVVSIHAPTWGATLHCRKPLQLRCRFNPRSYVRSDCMMCMLLILPTLSYILCEWHLGNFAITDIFMLILCNILEISYCEFYQKYVALHIRTILYYYCVIYFISCFFSQNFNSSVFASVQMVKTNAIRWWLNNISYPLFQNTKLCICNLTFKNWILNSLPIIKTRTSDFSQSFLPFFFCCIDIVCHKYIHRLFYLIKNTG